MTPSSKSPSYPYSRFIPREEIEVVASWRFDNVDGSPHADEAQGAAAANASAPSVAEPEPIAVDIDALCRQARSEGFEEGHAAGCAATRVALEVPARQAAAEAVQRFDTALATMRAQLAHAQVDMAHTVLEMACALAQQVVRRELATDPKAIEPVVRDALQALVTDTLPVTVRVHPDDFAALESGWMQPPEPGSPQFVADTAITPGGCRVEAPGSSVDATLEKRWQRAIANLGLDSAWEGVGTSPVKSAAESVEPGASHPANPGQAEGHRAAED
jgi:flagellar assembly protein FliH